MDWKPFCQTLALQLRKAFSFLLPSFSSSFNLFPGDSFFSVGETVSSLGSSWWPEDRVVQSLCPAGLWAPPSSPQCTNVIPPQLGGLYYAGSPAAPHKLHLLAPERWFLRLSTDNLLSARYCARYQKVSLIEHR